METTMRANEHVFALKRNFELIKLSVRVVWSEGREWAGANLL